MVTEEKKFAVETAMCLGRETPKLRLFEKATPVRETPLKRGDRVCLVRSAPDCCSDVIGEDRKYLVVPAVGGLDLKCRVPSAAALTAHETYRESPRLAEIGGRRKR